MKRNSRPALPGDGDTDYARYIRTDALLDLQRRPEEMVHRDELLFQVVHQSTELWLKLAVAELTEATIRIDDGEPTQAELLLARATLAVRLVTEQLEMFRHLTPPVYRLAEAMVEWDERVSLWRVRHYKIAIRIGSHGVIGSKGSPADMLAKLIDHRFFPNVWQVRANIALGGSAGHDSHADTSRQGLLCGS